MGILLQRRLASLAGVWQEWLRLGGFNRQRSVQKYRTFKGVTMRARNIKPGLFKNEILGEADPIYSLLFIGLWTLADKEGRLENRPKRIRAELFPSRFELDESTAPALRNHESFINGHEICEKSER